MKNTSLHTDHIKATILEKIENGEIAMKSKARFVFKIVVLTMIILATFIISILLTSYIFFSLRISNHEALLGFGTRGIKTFFDVFPWHLLTLEIILITILTLILKHFRFAYQRPILYLSALGLILSIIIGFGVSKLALHEHLLRQYERGTMPGGRYLYERIRIPPNHREVFQGKITSINKHMITIIGKNGVHVIEITSSIQRREPLNVGDRVVVAGDLVHGTIRAYGIHRAN